MSEPQKATITTRAQLMRALTLSVADHAALTRASNYAVRKAINDGEIPTVWRGARIRIPASYTRQVLGLAQPGDAPFNGAGS